MLCPDCLEDYEFVKFDVDNVTLEHRGIFRCRCAQEVTFPEFLSRTIISDKNIVAQLRISRLMHLSRSFKEKDKKTESVLAPGTIRLHTRHLERYLEHISNRSLRLLK